MRFAWLVYMHVGGCERPAFHYRADKLKEGEGLACFYARNLDGTDVFDDDEVVCGSCGNPLRVPLQWKHFMGGLV